MLPPYLHFLLPPFHTQSACVVSLDALLRELLLKMGAAVLPTYWLSPITGWSQSPELGGFSAGEGQAAVSCAGLLLSSVALSARLPKLVSLRVVCLALFQLSAPTSQRLPHCHAPVRIPHRSPKVCATTPPTAARSPLPPACVRSFLHARITRAPSGASRNPGRTAPSRIARSSPATAASNSPPLW